MTVILVSNRLPVSLRRSGGRLEAVPSPGGVAAGLGSIQGDLGARWFGWPGDVPAADHRRVASSLRKDFGCHPVFLPRQVAHAYYAGFSNGTVWPLFHSFSTYARYSAAEWNAYRAVNERFAEKIAKVLRPEDVVWVHDYHLLLLPRLLRERVPDARIGFFLHIPFPPYDVFRLLPWHREVLHGVLGADLVGFHTYDYARAFLGSVLRDLGYDNQIGTVFVGNRVVRVDVFPLGIDIAKFAPAVGPSSKGAAERMRRGMGPARLVFSISRLDYTKGIPEQLAAFERLLRAHPEWRGRVTYLLAVVPSRERVAEYSRLKREIDERVGRINSRWGTIGWSPIRYLYRQLEFDDLLALYRASDVALITPLRDGMNLVAKEYVAARGEAGGVLVLSEMAGASKELREALIVNPNDVEEVAEALHRALTMAPEEQSVRIRTMQERLRRNDAKAWGTKFLDRLDEVARLSRDLAVKRLSDADGKAVRQSYRRAGRRLLLLDYDGTLVPHTLERGARTGERVSNLLDRLVSDPANHVALVSGRTRRDLEERFADRSLTLVAEHGAWVRARGSGEWEAALPLDDAWKDRVRPVIEPFLDRVPGSSLEEKDFSLAWHYRGADVESGRAAGKELVDVLTMLTANLDLKVLHGSKVVEIRRAGVDKGTHFAAHLAREPWDLILAIGDDWTDEAMFASLPPDAVSIRIGFVPSAARFNVEGVGDVLDLLESLPAAHP